MPGGKKRSSSFAATRTHWEERAAESRSARFPRLRLACRLRRRRRSGRSSTPRAHTPVCVPSQACRPEIAIIGACRRLSPLSVRRAIVGNSGTKPSGRSRQQGIASFPSIPTSARSKASVRTGHMDVPDVIDVATVYVQPEVALQLLPNSTRRQFQRSGSILVRKA